MRRAGGGKKPGVEQEYSTTCTISTKHIPCASWALNPAARLLYMNELLEPLLPISVVVGVTQPLRTRERYITWDSTDSLAYCSIYTAAALSLCAGCVLWDSSY